MKAYSVVRMGLAGTALGAIALLGVLAAPHPAEGQSATLQDGKAGFVVSHISYALSTETDTAAICPQGTSIGPRDMFAATPEGQRQQGESDADYARRLNVGGQRMQVAANGQNLCANPEAGAPDPNQHTAAASLTAYGIDLDGQASRANGRAAPGTCAHDDFRGANGQRNVDNQFLRAVGCANTLLPGGQANGFVTEMLTGSWGILITLEDVENLTNDNDVTVRFFANNDPIQLSPTREVLTNATYATSPDTRYQATARGRIVNGVLTTEPVNVAFPMVANTIRLDRTLRDARLRMTIAADGSMDGVIGGYSPIDEIYDTVFGFRSGRGPDGQPANPRLRQGSASGYANAARHTCNGVYFALRQWADGHRDPATGQCNAISVQYRLRATPAFVVTSAERSQNQDLDTSGGAPNVGGGAPGQRGGY